MLLWALLAGGAATTAQWLPVTPNTPEASPRAAPQRGDNSRPASAAGPRWTSLPEREAIGQPAGDLFLARSWTPPRTKRAAIAAPPSPPPTPAAPAMPYRIAGKLVHDNRSQIVLAKGDAVFPVREGDTLEDGYRVEAIGRDYVTLLYLPLGMRETIELASPFAIR
jgi:hypothetical protein